ncbi:hypothetical protein C8R45DRAFT_1107500 [Mycena sanguinolenta]|nr:hypothetical protein C8R45DRAFT_1107500 [Mycena sanguinolenta]
MSQTSGVASRRPAPVHLLPVGPLNVPRRQTLSTATMTGESTYAAVHSRAVSASWATRLPPIDVSLETRRAIRPLPIPPSPKSAPPVPRRQVSQASLRPLPCVPECAAGVSVSVTPASPINPPPQLRTVRSNTHLSPPRILPPRQGTFVSLSLRLNTSPDALPPRAVDLTPSSTSPNASPATVDRPPSPPSPSSSLPEPPSPSTAHRKRLSKLRRHLGESVQLELFPAGQEDSIFQGKDVYSQTVVAVKKLLDLDSDDSDVDTSSGSNSEDDSEDDGYSLVFTHGQTRRAIPVKRYSRKWVRERGKDRWVEENYSNILRELRAL